MASVLVVDDDPDFLKTAREILELLGQEPRTAASLAEAREILDRDRFDLVILDFVLPDGSGMELLDLLAQRAPKRVAIVTGADGVRDTIRQISGPQLTFVLKPIDVETIEGLLAGIDDAEEAGATHFGLLVGESPAMQRIYTHIERVAPTDVSVLILGESGTGKELIAEALHRASGRRGKFVPINCGAFNRELIGSELFGHEKGAFTGASGRRVGCFERAMGGTLFLDEITEMPVDLQPTFLRVLESGRFLPVGAQTEKETDCRIIAATNRDPSAAVDEGLLREDLYFRLAEFTIDLPPLRARGDDVIDLARAFLAELHPDGAAATLDDDVVPLLREHPWSGNVRELRHVIQRAVLLRDLEAGRPDFAEALATSPVLNGGDRAGIEPGRSIADVERDLIEATLSHFDGDKKKTAETLGISLKTLYNRLNAYRELEASD